MALPTNRSTWFLWLAKLWMCRKLQRIEESFNTTGQAGGQKRTVVQLNLPLSLQNKVCCGEADRSNINHWAAENQSAVWRGPLGFLYVDYIVKEELDSHPRNLNVSLQQYWEIVFICPVMTSGVKGLQLYLLIIQRSKHHFGAIFRWELLFVQQLDK